MVDQPSRRMQGLTWARAALRAVLRSPLVLGLVALALLVEVATKVAGHRPFPPDTIPAGAYARIALAVAERRPKDMFAYLETEGQWASFTLHQARRDACEKVRTSYPAEQREKLLDTWKDEGDSADGPDAFARLAASRGWIARLERDLSGVEHVEIQGDRATVVTSRGTRYPFRRRENGIWGLTIFTAELAAEAERATRDLQMVERAAGDYERAKSVMSCHARPAGCPFSVGNPSGAQPGSVTWPNGPRAPSQPAR
jgi:hypothetical protein